MTPGTAVYMVPDHVQVSLGTSGTTVTVAVTEDHLHWIRDMSLTDGDTVAAENSNHYRLSKDEAGLRTARRVTSSP